LSLPLGNYEEARRVLDDERQREYNIHMIQVSQARWRQPYVDLC